MTQQMGSLPETRTLLLKHEQGVLHVTLNRPEVRNAINTQMLDELLAVFDAVPKMGPEQVRALVLRGAGHHFSAGGDLKEMMASGLKSQGKTGGNGGGDPLARMNRNFGTMLRKASNLPCVVIAVCEGATLAGGFGFACISDIALAHVDAKFGVPETTRGIPPAQIAPFIVERIGLMQARRLCLTGARFNGMDALKLGFVHYVFSDDTELDSRLAEILEQVRQCAPRANALTKAIVVNSLRVDMDEVLDDAAQKFAQGVRSDEAPEGIGAFMQKRKPKWAE